MANETNDYDEWVERWDSRHNDMRPADGAMYSSATGEQEAWALVRVVYHSAVKDSDARAAKAKREGWLAAVQEFRDYNDFIDSIADDVAAKAPGEPS